MQDDAACGGRVPKHPAKRTVWPACVFIELTFSTFWVVWWRQRVPPEVANREEMEGKVLGINMQDVMNVLNLCKPYLIALGVAVVIAIVVQIAAIKIAKPKRHAVRVHAAVASVVVIAIILNLIATGPMSNMLNLVAGHSGAVSEETTEEQRGLGREIADNGIVLLENNGTLPLEEAGNVNVFGWSAAVPVYGGTGSGGMNDNFPTVTLVQGLEDAGFTVNEAPLEFYTEYAEARPTNSISDYSITGGDWTLPEPPVESYPEGMMDEAKEFSDTAIMVIGRVGGEGADLPGDMSKVTYNNNSADYADFEAGQSYLDASQTELRLLDDICENFENVIVVYTGANAFNMSFLDSRDGVDAAIWVPGAGQMGFDSLGNIITGAVNPSGRTADTFLRDFSAAPWHNNFGSFWYANGAEVSQAGPGPTFVNYVEGIYVGYRYYETAADEGVIDYDAVVQYPFGYGLSYTTFEQEMGELVDDGQDNLSLDVTVTNTGDVAGREVVQAYVNPPYTNGGIEKASANLVAFDKTGLLEPGASETVTLNWSAEDMASYDETAEGGAGAYVLEAGDYVISVNENSHVEIASTTYAVPETITYGDDSPRSTDLVAAHNEFEGDDTGLVVLSRADGFANLAQATAAPTSYDMSEDQKAQFVNTSLYDVAAAADPDAEMPTTGANNGVTLAELRGKDYDDPQWDELLDQLTVEDMNELIANGGYQTKGISSIGKAMTLDVDGPAALNNNFTGKGSIGMPASATLACSWFMNSDQAVRNGGDMALAPYSVGTNTVNVTDATGVTAMRSSAHNIRYTVVNSNAYVNGGNLSPMPWQIALVAADVVIVAALALGEWRLLRRTRQEAKK